MLPQANKWKFEREQKAETLTIKKHIGKLVVVAHWQDFKLQDPTKLGILQCIVDGRFYIANDPRAYRHCRLVSQRRINISPEIEV